MSVKIVVGDNEHEWNRKRPEPDFAVYVQDFDNDDYHRESHEPSSDLERQVRRIQRRYRKLDKYLVAVAAYNEYMVYLVEKNGGPDMFKLKQQQHLITDFIPPKPRLRQNALNNFLMKNKVVLSSVDLKKIDPQKLEDVVDRYLYDPEVHDDSEGLLVEPAEEGALRKKLLKKAEHEMAGSDGRELSRISTIARLEAFHLNRRQIVQEDVYEGLHEISMTALINGEYEDPDEYNPLQSVNYRGRYVTAEVKEQLEFYATLNEAGWNAMKIQRKQSGAKSSNTSSRVNRLLRDESKSLKMKSKKSKKKKKQVGNFLTALAEKSGRQSFEDYQKEVFKMTTNNSSDY